jgi:taurine dioxygenase
VISHAPLEGGIGIRIDGLDLSRPIADRDAQALRELWLIAGLLVFPSAFLTGEQLVAFSRIFGDLEVHPAREAHVEGQPELTAIQYHPDQCESATIYEVHGKRLANWLPWHIDLIYMPRIARAGVLQAVTIPSVPADTGFMDRIALHRSLPEHLKAQIAGRRILYRLQPLADRHRHFPAPYARAVHIPDRVRALAERVQTDFPTVTHPLEFAQPGTGRMVLNFCPLFIEGIEGMGDTDATELIDALRDHILASPDRHYHRWQPGDVVLWDNWRMLHSAEGTPVDHARRLNRATVAGDYGLGRVYHPESAAA